MSDQLTYFGIDLGTTYSAISYVDETGRPTVITDPLGGTAVTASAVYFENANNVVVGQAAKDVAKLFPDKVVQRVKRAMGKDNEWMFNGTTYSPESISALILKRLAEYAREATGREVRQVVITVPAYFGMLERTATAQAGRIAGLDVIGIVPEPVAAALQYEVEADGPDRTVLVYDLGGGTFDTTVIRIGDGTVEVLCTDGDQELGGVDWDDRLVSHLLREFRSQANPADDPEDDAEFMQELTNIAEGLKRQLSQTESRSVPLRFAGATAMVEVTRAGFEQLTEDLLDRTIDYTGKTLDKLAAKLGTDVESAKGRIDEVLLVGGSTKMPAVAARLTKEFGWTCRVHDPDLAVAKGAAKFALSRAVWQWDAADDGAAPPDAQQRHARAAAIARQTGIDADALANMADLRITNVLPKAFGVKLVDTGQPRTPDGEYQTYIQHLVHADDPLPSGPHVLNAGTVEANQTEVMIEVYEQAGSVESRDLSANKPVDQGAGLISGLSPNLPAGSPVDITMTVTDEGLLSVHAVEPRSGRDLTIQLRVSVRSEEEIRQAAATVRGITVKG